MNYKKLYDALIERAKGRTLTGYKENHHIIPKCMGGDDNKENLVYLTAREHFLAHLMLVEINPKQYGLINAVHMMCLNSETQLRGSKNRMYGWLRERFSKSISFYQQGERNSQFGNSWVFNEDLKQSKTVPKIDLEEWLSIGWTKGRKLSFDPKSEKNCKKCGAVNCVRPDICSKHQMINTMITVFDFDKTSFGSEKFYEEYDRVVKMIHDEYHINMFSTVEISRKYGISSQRVDSIFKSLGITPRSYQEGIENFNRKTLTLVR